MSKKTPIQSMFDAIASRYDTMNTLLSLGMHRLWNRVFVRMLGESHHLVDLCAGTGQVALGYIHIYPEASATLIDFSQQMLHYVQHKYPQAPFTYIHEDVSVLSLPSNSQTTLSMAYGLRNLPSPQQSLNEGFRVLQPGGTFGILELTAPKTHSPMRFLHTLYLNYVVPMVGKYYARNQQAYQYLSESIQKLPQDTVLEELFQKAGFIMHRKKKLLWGVATIWILKKPA